MLVFPLSRPWVLSVVLSLAVGAAFGLQTQALPGAWGDALVVSSLPDGSLLVAERNGHIDRLAREGSGYRDPAPWADLSDEGSDELLGLAVDPDYLASGYVYAVLRSHHDQRWTAKLTRWRDSGGQVVLNRVLVDDLPSGPERAGGVLEVGPDGKLWLGLGDGAAPPSEVSAAAGRGVLLRYNADGSVPDDNPSPSSAVWCSGLRDPSGLAWQPGTGRLYGLDRGPVIPRGTMDELNLIDKGANYGWPRYLGRDVAPGVSKPVIYCSSGHSWVPGGAVFVTSGEWKDSLLFAGAGQGILYRLTLDPKSPAKITFYEELIGGDLGPLVDVALGPDDEVVLLSREHLYRLAP